MQPNVFIAYLASSLSLGGSETEIYLTAITTLTGETITTSQFATFGRGIVTIDPDSPITNGQSQVEFCSFTGVDSTGIGFTGVTRGLSAISNSVVAANKKYHPAGTPVVISFGYHDLQDLVTYINGLVTGVTGTSTDTATGVLKITQNMGSLPRAKHALVSQQSSPNMTLKVQPFSFVGQSSLNVNFAGGNTPSMTAPVSNPRIDLVVYDTMNSVIAVRKGTENASPSRPTPTNGDILLASVYHTTAETLINERNDATNGYIQQWYEPTQYVTTVNLPASAAYSAETDQSQATQNATINVGEANATTKHSLIAQSFIPTVTAIKGVKLYKSSDTGTFTGTVVVSLQADSSGSPSGSSLASYTITNAAWLTLTAGAEFSVSFSSEYESLVVGNTYWIVISCSTNDTSNHPVFGTNSAGGYANGLVRYNNSTDGWVTISTVEMYFKTMLGVLNKVVESNLSDGLIPIKMGRTSFITLDKTSASTSSTTLSTFFTTQLEGGFIGPNQGLKIKVRCSVTTNANSTSSQQGVTIKVNYAGAAAATIQIQSVNSSSGQGSYNLDMDIYIINQGAMNSQAYTYFAQSQLGSTDAVTLRNSFVSNGTASADFSQPGALTLTAQASVTTNNGMSYLFSSYDRIG